MSTRTKDRSSSRVALVVATVALGVALLLGFKSPDELAANARPRAGGIGSAGGTASAGGAGAQGGGTGGSATGSNPASGSGANGGSSAGSGSSGGGSSGSGAAGAATVTGPEVDNRFGPVQVQVSVKNGTLVDVEAVALPSGGRSGRISDYAGPILRSEALTARSANIDIVSGATYTSESYARSLQAALDQAGIRG